MQSHGIASDPQAEEMKQLAQQQRDEESRVTVEYLAQLMASNQALTERIDELQSRADRPRVVKRDAAGLMVSIDDAPVTRDAAGRITQIG
jgi:ABC-type phosphate transport system auxiliary subunit